MFIMVMNILHLFFLKKKKITENGHLFSSILYFYNQLNFYYNNSFKYFLDVFWENISKNFNDTHKFFPREKTINQKFHFHLNDYLKDLMLYDNIQLDVLYSFLINYLNINKKNYYIFDVDLLIFLLEEIWDFNYSNSNIKSEILNSTDYLQKLKICLSHINKNKTYIFSSIILLRRIFPLILKLFKCFKINENYEDFKNIQIEIFSHENEKIFDNMIEKNIKKNSLNIDNISDIIKLYFKTLKKTMDIFHIKLFWEFFGNQEVYKKYFKKYKIKKNENEIVFLFERIFYEDLIINKILNEYYYQEEIIKMFKTRYENTVIFFLFISKSLLLFIYFSE